MPAMSHHRETVTADPGPPAAGPYSHAVISNGLVFLSGQTPVDPDTGQLVEGSIGDQTRRCLDNLAIVAAAAGAQLADAVRVGIYVTDISTFKDVNEAYATYFAERPAGAQHDRRRRAAAGGRGRDRHGAGAARLMAAVTAADVTAARRAVEAIARRTPMLSTRTISERAGGVGGAEGREPPAHRLVQDPRRLGQARRARRGRLPQRRRRGLGGQPRAEPGGRRAGARHPVRGVRARRRAAVQGRGRARAGGDRPHRRRVGRRLPGARAGARARRAGWPSCTRSTTPTSWPGRARSGSSCSRTCPTSPRWSCRSAAAACARAWRSPSRRRGRTWRWSACRPPPARPTPSRCAAASRCPPARR